MPRKTNSQGKTVKPAAVKKPVVKAAPDLEENEIPENIQEDGSPEEIEERALYWVPYGVSTFADLMAAEDSVDKAEELELRISQLRQMLFRALEDSEITDKVGAFRTLFDEFIDLAAEIMEETGESVPAGSLEFAESFAGVLVLEEAEKVEESDPGDLLYLNVRLIKPGWGNTKTNFYYPAEMLRRDAEKFDGAKMYETDHKEEEKSTRTWVSTVKSITVDEDGSPIGRVAVHDPGFARRVRNLKKGGLLERLECSISAMGIAGDEHKEGDRKGRKVSQISAVDSVDWVTRAGAGGKALDLAENESQEESNMPKLNDAMLAILEASSLPDFAKVRLQAGEFETEEALNTAIQAESEYLEAAALAAGDPANIQENDDPPAPPEFLEESAVLEILEASSLPEFAKARIKAGKYSSADAVTVAISAEVDYLKAAGAGKPSGLGYENGSAGSVLSAREKEAAADKAKGEILSRQFGR